MLLAIVSLASCGTTSNSGDNTNNNDGGSDSLPDEPQTYKYTAYDKNNKVVGSYDSIWTAIVAARNKLRGSYVLRNSDEVQVFKCLGVNDSQTSYCFLGDEYVKTCSTKAEAHNWADDYPNSYVLNGQATEFTYVGKRIYTDKGYNKDDVVGIENMSASYGFIYPTTGHTLIEFTVKLSEAKFKYISDNCNEDNWMGYVFVNFQTWNPWCSIDLGIMCITDDGEWTPFFNVAGSMNNPTFNPNAVNGMINPASPSVPQVTKMTKNQSTGYYENGDDIHFVVYLYVGKPNSCYVIEMTNLRTNQVYHYEYINNALTTSNASTARITLAASYCPDNKYGSFWNPRSGTAFENVKFENIKVAYNLNHGNRKDFAYGTSNFDYALFMGGDNGEIQYGSNYFTLNMRNYFK